MTDPQRNYLNMAGVSLKVMHDNNGKWSTNTKISGNVTDIEAIVADIYTEAGIQATQAKGATLSEHECWKIAADRTDHICYGLKAYYNDINDTIEYEKVNYTMSDFMYGARLDVIKIMQTVHDNAAGLQIALLADYNVIAQEITDQQSAITDFTNSVPERDVMKTVTKAATSALPGLFTQLRAKFKSLDLKMGTLKSSQRKFYDSYINARIIIDLGKTQQAVELHLMAQEYQAIFGKKFKIGSWFTIRNHSDFPAVVYLTNTPSVLDVKNEVTIPPNSGLKLEVPVDFKNIFGHYLMVVNQNTLDEVRVTIIRAKNKSLSQENELADKVK